MNPSARVRIRVRVQREHAWHAQLIAPILGVDAVRLTELLRTGAVYFGPYSEQDADSMAQAIRCFGVQCVLEKPVLRMNDMPTVREGVQNAGRYMRRFVKRPVRRLA